MNRVSVSDPDEVLKFGLTGYIQLFLASLLNWDKKKEQSNATESGKTIQTFSRRLTRSLGC